MRFPGLILALLATLPLAGCGEPARSNAANETETESPERPVRPAAGATDYQRDAFLATLPPFTAPRYRDWTQDEKDRIAKLIGVVETDNYDAWKTARQTLQRMGNGAVNYYITALVWRVTRDQAGHAEFSATTMDMTRNQWQDVQTLMDRHDPEKDFAVIGDDVWEIVKGEFTAIGNDAILPLLAIVAECPAATQSYLWGDMLVQLGEPVIHPMLIHLRDTSSDEFRYRLTYLLRFFPDKRTSEAAAAVLDLGATDALRAQAATSLVYIGMTPSIPRIHRALGREREAWVRKLTVFALGHFTDTAALGTVQAALADENDTVRSQAAAALGARKHFPAAPTLIEQLSAAVARSRTDTAAMREANYALGALKELAGGKTYGYDPAAWQRWYEAEKMRRR